MAWRTLDRAVRGVVRRAEVKMRAERASAGDSALPARGEAGHSLIQIGGDGLPEGQQPAAEAHGNGVPGATQWKRTPAETGASEPTDREVVSVGSESKPTPRGPKTPRRVMPTEVADPSSMSLIVARSRAAPRGRANRPRSATIIEMSDWKRAHAEMSLSESGL